jgi:excisionase family DNA binding protein
MYICGFLFTNRQGELKYAMENSKKYTTWGSLPDTLTALHISQYLGISRRRVYELLQKNVDYGGIPNFSIGTSKRVEKSDFKQWIVKLKKKREVNL